VPGSYPDVPSRRIAYDADGTVMWQATTISGGTFGGGGLFTGMQLPPTEIASTDVTEWNDEDSVTVISAGGPAAVDYGHGWVWPEKRDVFGFYGYVTRNDVNDLTEIQTSTDSRNMITGTFSTLDTNFQGVPGNNNWSVEQSYREFIYSYNSTGTTGARVRTEVCKTVGCAVDKAQFMAFHWYGDIADGANPDRLLFINHGTGLAYDEVQDWGDLPRGATFSIDIHLLNNSATLTATSNTITFEGLYEDSYTWYDIRDNSGASTAFSTQINPSTSIGPGTVYPLSTSLTLRITLDPDENLGPAAARMKLETTGTWT